METGHDRYKYFYLGVNVQFQLIKDRLFYFLVIKKFCFWIQLLLQILHYFTEKQFPPGALLLSRAYSRLHSCPDHWLINSAHCYCYKALFLHVTHKFTNNTFLHSLSWLSAYHLWTPYKYLKNKPGQLCWLNGVSTSGSGNAQKRSLSH